MFTLFGMLNVAVCGHCRSCSLFDINVKLAVASLLAALCGANDVVSACRFSGLFAMLKRDVCSL